MGWLMFFLVVVGVGLAASISNVWRIRNNTSVTPREVFSIIMLVVNTTGAGVVLALLTLEVLKLYR